MARFLVVPIMGMALLASAAWADDCPADAVRNFPKAREGALAYSYIDKCYYVCDGTGWVSQCSAALQGSQPVLAWSVIPRHLSHS